MRKKMMAGLLVVALCALAGMLFWTGTDSSVNAQRQIERDEQAQPENVLARINNKARIAGGGDETAVRELANDVVESFSPVEVPAFTRETMKDRLARAELSYRLGVRGGISENDLALSINQLAEQFGAPEYAKTNVGQVRVLRVGLMMEMPDLIGTGAPVTTDDGRTSIGDMSPSEAVSIALLMVQQKMTNPAYQVTPQEFVANLNRIHRERWEALTAATGVSSDEISTDEGNGEEEAPVLITGSGDDSKRNEMIEVIDRAVMNMAAEDLTSLADRTLDALGIER